MRACVAAIHPSSTIVRRVVAGLLLAAAAPLQAAFQTTPLYPFHRPGADYCSPPTISDLHDDGRAVGLSACYVCQDHGCVGTPRATLWENGQAIDLGTLGEQSSQAFATNASGDVAAVVSSVSSVSGSFIRGAVLTGGGGTMLAPAPGDVDSLAYDLNDVGVVVGTTYAADLGSRPALWDGASVSVLPFTGDEGQAIGIDRSGGVLILDFLDAEEDCGRLRYWTPTSDVGLGLDVCSYYVGSARMSPGGLVVGPEETGAVRYVEGGTVPLGTPEEGWVTAVNAVNDAGAVVGAVTVPASSPAGAFVTHAAMFLGGQVVDLAPLVALPTGKEPTSAVAVNGRGQIVVVAQGVGSVDGVFLLTPVCGDGPDPGQPCDDGDADDRDGCKSDCTPNVCGDGVVRDGVEQCDDGGGAADGCALDCTITPETVAATVAAGGTVATNGASGGAASPSNPLATAVTTPTGGTVTITEGGFPAAPPAGYGVVGALIEIAAPPGTAADPLRIAFRVDASLLPSGASAATLTVFRNAVPVAECPGGLAGGAVPSPCVGARETLADGDVRLVVLTTAASAWMLAVPTTCGDGTADAGEQCDDGNRIGGDCCAADCTIEPAGSVCRAADGPCDVAEACTGSAATCPADQTLPDDDVDGVCDGVDPCVGGGLLSKAKLKLTKLGAATHDEGFTLKGMGPPPGTLAPSLHGLRVLVDDAGGMRLFDATVPPGAFDPASKTGWKGNAAGTSWRWKGAAAGVTTVALKRTPDALKVTVKAKNATIGTPAALPLRGTVVLVPPRAVAGDCAVTALATCVADGAATKVTCR